MHSVVSNSGVDSRFGRFFLRDRTRHARRRRVNFCLCCAYRLRFGMASDRSSILTRSKSVTDGGGTRPPPSSRQHDRPVLDTSETRNRTGAHYHSHVDGENMERKGIIQRKTRNQYIATHALEFLRMKRRRRRHGSIWEILDGILGIIISIWVGLHDVLDRKCIFRLR